MVGYKMEKLPVKPEYVTKLRPAQPCGSFCDCIENGLKVCRRTRDHTQDLARRTLLLQGFFQILLNPSKRGRFVVLRARACGGDRIFRGFSTPTHQRSPVRIETHTVLNLAVLSNVEGVSANGMSRWPLVALNALDREK
jgi:hypothetical protein